VKRKALFVVFLSLVSVFFTTGTVVAKKDSFCTETKKSFLNETYTGTPAENASRIRLFTESGAGTAALVEIDDQLYLFTAGHVLVHSIDEDMFIYIPGCGVLPNPIDSDLNQAYKSAYDNIMIYPLLDYTKDQLADYVSPLPIALAPPKATETVYMPDQTNGKLFAYYVATADTFELFINMWYENEMLCESQSGGPALNGKGEIVGVLSQAPRNAQINEGAEKACFNQAYVVPIDAPVKPEVNL